MKYTLAALLLLVSAAAHGQAQQVDYIGIVTWPAVTQRVDNSAFTPTKYRIWVTLTQLTSIPATGTPAEVAGNLTTWTHSVRTTTGSTWYYYVQACSATACGALSPPGSKIVPTPGAPPEVLPKAPGAPTISVTTTSITTTTTTVAQ